MSPAEYIKEDHRSRHVILHNHLDELVSDWITQTSNAPSKATVLELLQWSYLQTIEPDERR